MAETDISGNFANRPSEAAIWLDDGKVEHEGIKLARYGEKPFSIDFDMKRDDTSWITSTNRAAMVALKPDYLVAAPGNALHTDLARLRRENRHLRERVDAQEARRTQFVQGRRELERRRTELERRERDIQLREGAAKSIQQALARRRGQRQRTRK